MEFDKKDRLFRFIREVQLASTPTVNDKVVIDIDGIGYVFKVYDVHFSEEGRTDVNLIRHSTITDYNSSGFADIE
jgi:hypothetical protein